MKKSALGRGLDALMPEINVDSGLVVNIDIKSIDNNLQQPRRTFDEESLNQLADSIREIGLLQPILVSEQKNRFVIVAGERRFRAARIAGLTTVPCIVRDFTHEERMEAALIENLQREDLNPFEEAQAIRSLMDACHYTQEAAAQRLGKSRPAIANLLRLLTLPEEIHQMLVEGTLSEGHARTLLGVDTPKRQIELAAITVKEGLSVRALEKLISKPQTTKAPVEETLLPEMVEFEESLHRALGARASVRGNLDKGKIVITYRNRSELEAIYEAAQKLLQA